MDLESPSIDAPSRAEWVAARAGDLPVLPQVASRVLHLVSDPDVRNGELEIALSRDQALTARILKISNSALYGQRGAVGTLRRAIAVLGLNTLRSVVIAASTRSLYQTKGSRFEERILWEHALAVAIASRLIAHQVRFPGGEEAFTAGLLHDIGKVVLDQNLGDAYRTVLERVYNDGGGFVLAEREILGFDHAEVGAVVVRKWSLAPDLEEAVRLHHSPADLEGDGRLCRIVSLGNTLCVKAGIGPEKHPELELASNESAVALGLDAGTLECLEESLAERFAEEKSTFGLD